MAAPVTAVTNLGQINVAGSEEALFLKVPAGEVLTSFEETNVTLSRIMTRQMPAGAKSLQFPGIGKAVTRWHEAGANLLTDTGSLTDSTTHDGNVTPSQATANANFLSNINLGEREVFIDQPLKSLAFIDDWEQFKSSFDASAPVTTELGRALAVDNDKNLLRLIAKGTLPVATAPGAINWSTSSIPAEFKPTDGQMEFTDANAGTDGSVLLDQIRQCAETWDLNDVPEMDRFCALAPSHYNLLVQNQDLLNRDFGGANGIFADGTVFKAWGVELMKTNHIPGDSFGTYGAPIGTRGTSYDVDAATTVACLWQKSGLAGVRAGSISMEKGRLIHYGGTLLVASLATGYDILRPFHLGIINTVTPT